MHRLQRQRAAQLLEEAGVELALFSDHDSVRWLTGLALPAPALLLFERGSFTLLADEGYADASAFAAEPDCAHLPFVGYTIQQPIDAPGRLADALRDLVAASSGLSGPVGVEEKNLPLACWQKLCDALPGCEPVSLEGRLLPLRAVKTEEELARIREGFRLVTVGQDAGRNAVRLGQREIDVWTEVQTAVEREAGKWMQMGNDCIVGHRPANIGAAPLDYEIIANDSLILDLSVVVDGYWTDSCATYYTDQPTAQQVQMHMFVEEALAYAFSLIRPGEVAQEVDRKVRSFMAGGRLRSLSPPHRPRYRADRPRSSPYCPLQPGVDSRGQCDHAGAGHLYPGRNRHSPGRRLSGHSRRGGTAEPSRQEFAVVADWSLACLNPRSCDSWKLSLCTIEPNDIPVFLVLPCCRALAITF